MKLFSGTPHEWNKLISSFPDTHILQTWEWSKAKAEYGWEPFPLYWETPENDNRKSKQVSAAAMVLKRRIPIGGFSSQLSVMYSPRGPLLNWDNEKLRNEVLNDLQQFAKNQRAIFIKIDPGIPIGSDIVGNNDQAAKLISIEYINELKKRGWIFSQDQIQFRNTAIINLEGSEDEILASFKQKTRYNIRLAIKKGITVRPGTIEDLDLLYEMYAETSIRDRFIIRDKDYYLTIWNKFIQNNDDNANPSATPLIAEFEGIPVAAILIFNFCKKAYYLYGMSRNAHRERMPNYLLQWEAIKFSKSIGCTLYDLWGAPDELNEKDPMWGVYRFKTGLGASLLQTPGAWDFPSRPIWYKVYTQVIPKVLNLMRVRGRAQTKRSLSMN